MIHLETEPKTWPIFIYLPIYLFIYLSLSFFIYFTWNGKVTKNIERYTVFGTEIGFEYYSI